MTRKFSVKKVMKWKDYGSRTKESDPRFDILPSYHVLDIDNQGEETSIYLLVNDNNDFIWVDYRLCKFAKFED